MTARVPAHLAALSESMRAALVAHVAKDYAENPPPPLPQAMLDALRVLLRRPGTSKRAA